MLIAHVPGGYLLTAGLLRLMKVVPGTLAYRQLMWVGIVAAILPDFDLLYWEYIDHRQTLHHRYYTHTPYFWFCLFGSSLLVATMIRSRLAYQASLLVFVNTLVHMFFDSFTGSIRWGWPFNWSNATTFFEVPAHYDWWVWNFVLHPTFFIECLIVMLAAITWWRRNVQGRRMLAVDSI